MANRRRVEEQELLMGVATQDEKAADTARLWENKPTWRRLPEKRQLVLLALCRLSAPLSNACLLPYLYDLVKSILSDPNHTNATQKISRLTGLLVAAYPIGQMSTSMVCGRLSDIYGRKPIIVLGLLISVIANFAFGFSRSIGMLLFWRVLAGMANGTLGVMRTMTAEIVKERRYQTRAFLALPVVFNSGRVSALIVGGCLADPVRNLPSFFGPAGIFNLHNNPDGVAWTFWYPYALPSIFNGAVLAVCLLLASYCLKETLPERETISTLNFIVCNSMKFVRHIFVCRDAGYNAIPIEEGSVPKAGGPVLEADRGASTSRHDIVKLRRPSFSQIWTRHLLQSIVAFGLLPLHNATFLHVFPVFLSMPISPNDQLNMLRFSGGLGLTSPTVGVFLGIFGIFGIVLQLFVYPCVQGRIGTLGAFRLANAMFPMSYMLAPYLALFAQHSAAKWVVMATVLFVQVMARTMAIPSSVILLTEAAPQRSVLGTVHGAGNTLSSLASAIGPIVGGMLLARGINAGAVGIVWWCWLSTVALAALAWSFIQQKGKDVDDGSEEVPLV